MTWADAWLLAGKRNERTLLQPLNLPDFPWDKLGPYRELAQQYPGGMVDLSVGTPVDDTPVALQEALVAAANAPAYPAAAGSEQLRAAIAGWFTRCRGVRQVRNSEVIATVGSKEMVAWLPLMLGIRPGSRVLIPEVAYPTYDIGARIAAAEIITVGEDARQWPAGNLAWVNSPGNPHGHVWSVEQLRWARQWAQENNAVVAADECYAMLPSAEPWISQGVPSLLDERVCAGDFTGLLVLHSLSKQCNLAGYRAAFMAGDADLIDRVLQVRKHTGMMVPAPVQAAMAVALTPGGDQFVMEQAAVYRRRRAVLEQACAQVGLQLDPLTSAGLYLWVKYWQSVDSWKLIQAFAEVGVLVAPGDFYGTECKGLVRIALTGTDAQIQAAGQRILEIRLP